MSQDLNLYSLGGISVSLDNQIIGEQFPLKAKAFLVYICRQSKPQSREKLASLFWSELTAERAAHNLRVTLMPVREMLSDYVEITRTEIHVDTWLDANIFGRTLDSLRPQLNGEQPFSQVDIDSLEGALALYRGDFLMHVNLADASGFDEWVDSEREGLRQRYILAGTRLLEALTTTRRYRDGIDLALRLLSVDPLREDTHRRLMTLYAVSGDRTSALQGFERFQGALWDELGVEPDDETIALYERIAAHEVDVLPDSPLVIAGALSPTNLPGELSPFLGRENELAQIAALFVAARCVTLVGTGGIGKTRLALKAAERQRSSFPDGVWWVELAPVLMPAAVAVAIRSALGINETPTGSLSEVLCAHLRDKRLLLVLDNFEHVLDAAELVEVLLRAAPDLRVLITSREPLRLYGEYAYEVPVLTRAEASEMFIDRAKAIQPNLQTEVALVDALCARLDDLPLALELAASGARTQSLSKILARLELSRLQSPLRGVPERQRTLFNTVEWSYQLLTPDEQQLYRGLAYFVGTWTDEAAAAVCGEVHGLDTLVEKSLLRRIEDEHGEARYSMLETIRQHARITLNEADEASDTLNAYLDYYVGFAEMANVRLRGRDEKLWIKRLQSNIDNLHAAIKYAAESGEVLAEARLVAALGRFWYDNGLPRDARAFGERVLRHREYLPPDVLAGVLAALGHSAFVQGERQQARSYHGGALELYEQVGDVHGQAYMNLFMGSHSTDPRDKLKFGQRAYEMLHDIDEISTFGSACNNLAIALYTVGAIDEAEAVVREGLARVQGMGLLGEALLLNMLSGILREQGHVLEAIAALEAYFQLEQRPPFFDINSHMEQGWLLVYLERLDEADAHCAHALEIIQRTGHRYDYGTVRCLHAVIADARDNKAVMKDSYSDAFFGVAHHALATLQVLALSIGLAHLVWRFAREGWLTEAMLLKAGLEQALQQYDYTFHYAHHFFLDKAAPLLADTPLPAQAVPDNPFAYALECLARFEI